jgi:hypothetical protein
MWPAPSMVISPAVVAVEHLVELDPVPGRVGRGDAGHPHREGDDARHPLRVVGGEPQRPPHTIAAQADQHRRLRAGGGQDRLQVGDALLVGVSLGRDRQHQGGVAVASGASGRPAPPRRQSAGLPADQRADREQGGPEPDRGGDEDLAASPLGMDVRRLRHQDSRTTTRPQAAIA